VNPYLIQRTFRTKAYGTASPEPDFTWDVGHYDGQFVVLRSFETLDQAAAFLHYLNGGLQDESRLIRALEMAAERLDRIWRGMPR
jgi:hypothetical protein